jgi:hypothetical protein
MQVLVASLANATGGWNGFAATTAGHRGATNPIGLSLRFARFLVAHVAIAADFVAGHWRPPFSLKKLVDHSTRSSPIGDHTDPISLAPRPTEVEDGQRDRNPCAT